MFSSRRLCYALVLLELALASSRPACAESRRTFAAYVLGRDQGQVVLDTGSIGGMVEGQTVVLYAESGEPVYAVVRSVTSTQARCEVLSYPAPQELRLRAEVVAGSENDPLAGLAPAATGNRSAPGPLLAAAAMRQEAAVERVNVRVTAYSGGSVYLDKGTAAGIQPGDVVSLFPPGRGIVNGTIESVSRNSSRCSIDPRSPPIDIGTRGEVVVQPARAGNDLEEISPAPRQIPEHPPWSRPPDDWDQTMPLLAPAYATDPADREREYHGRLYGQYLHTWNSNVQDNQYSFALIGARLTIDNPFQRGGGLLFDGQTRHRAVLLADQPDQIGDLGRFSRLSYHWGGTTDRPWRYELGRFLPSEFPEFGIIDGGELVYRTRRGNRFGVTAGFLPIPFPTLGSLDDFQVSAFYRFVAGEDEKFSTAVAFQKTWHQGIPDRDLLIITGDYVPNEHFSIYGTVWGDFFDSRDTLETTSFEVSQVVVQPVLQLDPGHGIGAYVSQVRWPQLLRTEYLPYIDSEITGDYAVRYGLYTWQQILPRVRLDGRVDQWQDQSQQTGTNWETQVAFRDLLFQGGELALAVYEANGLYSNGPGGRIAVRQAFSKGAIYLAYDVLDVAFIGHRLSIVQQSIRASADLALGCDWSLTLTGDYFFGQHQNAIQGGTFVQKRF